MGFNVNILLHILLGLQLAFTVRPEVGKLHTMGQIDPTKRFSVDHKVVTFLSEKKEEEEKEQEEVKKKQKIL